MFDVRDASGAQSCDVNGFGGCAVDPVAAAAQSAVWQHSQ